MHIEKDEESFEKLVELEETNEKTDQFKSCADLQFLPSVSKCVSGEESTVNDVEMDVPEEGIQEKISVSVTKATLEAPQINEADKVSKVDISENLYEYDRNISDWKTKPNNNTDTNL